MKRKFLVCLAIALSFLGTTRAQYVTLQDTAFRDMMIAQYPTCFNVLKQMDTTCTSIVQATSLTVSDSRSELTNLDGIKYFKGLKFLELQYGHNMTSLAQLPDSLEIVSLHDNLGIASVTNIPRNIRQLYISDTKLTTLPAYIQFTKLKELGCNNGLLTSLPPLPATIEWLNVSKNKLTSLPRLDTLTNLTVIGCSDNLLTAVPALRTDTSGVYPGYTVLDFKGNLLTSFPSFNSVSTLNISHNKFTSWPTLRPNSVFDLICGDNPINYLPPIANGGPSYLSCQNLSLTALPPLPSYLKKLDCARNPIPSLSALPATLEILICYKNAITSLPALPATLTDLFCDSNNITTLPALPGLLQKLSIIRTNIKCLPKLPSSMQYLSLNSRMVRCIPNSGSNMTVLDSNGSIARLPFCTPTNNVNTCQAFPTIRGRVFYDLNSNGTLDVNEHGKPKFKVALSNGAFAITDDSGFYKLSPDTLANVSISVTPPVLFNALPANKVYNFTTSDTTVLQNIALQPAVIKDSVVVYVVPYSRARPGFNISYGVRYENVGTTNLSNISATLRFDTALLRFNNTFGPGVSQSGNTISLNSGVSLPVGSFGGFGGDFTIKTTTPLGTVLRADATASGGSSSVSDSSFLIVVGSFDPNDKIATDKLTPAQVAADGYVDYVVRFQNTGTDTAFHVVIADTLSSKLKANSFQLIATSHLCKTSIKDNVLMFEMRNIMLPDSNVNEPASHGYLRFRIKVANGLVVGDTITNKAAIYFDYNSPIITNTAVTQIVTTTLPLQLLSFTAKRQDKTNLLNWTTTNELNVDRFEVERSTTGREFTRLATVAAVNRSANSSYSYTDNSVPASNVVYYRLKMIDRDGTFEYSPIRQVSINSSSLNIALYPNPAKDVLQVLVESDKKRTLQVQLLSMDGKVLQTVGLVATEGSTQRSINISRLQKGSYLLKVLSGEDVQVVKFEKL